MDLTTTYLGLKLRNPLVASASPLSEELDNFRKLEDAGIAAIVHYSLFEEQITRDIFEMNERLDQGKEHFPEALTYMPEPEHFELGPEEYLRHIEKAKKAVSVPVIASLNGRSLGGWTEYAKKMESAGADALELNIYFLSTDPGITSQQVEDVYVEILHAVKETVKIPVAVKLAPFFSAMANMAKRLETAGADGLVLFNRFYQPDIDLASLEVTPNLLLSSPQAMRLPLRWIAILRDHLKLSLAATSGIHYGEDVIKMLLVGADATMLCSSLLKNGISHVAGILQDIQEWMEDNEYSSISQLKGSMSQKSSEDPQAFERANYIKTLKSFR